MSIIHFRRLTLGIALTLLAVSASWAGKHIYVEQVESRSGMMGQPASESTQKIWFGDGKVRVEDGASGMATIFDTVAKKMTVIPGDQEQYYEMTEEELKAMSEMSSKMFEQMAGGEPSEPTVNISEETKKIGTWNTNKVEVDMGGAMPMKMTMWVSKEVPVDPSDWRTLTEFVQMQGPMKKLVEALTKVEGFPVLQEMQMTMMGMTMEVKTELKVAKEVEADASRFAPPANYKKVEGGMGAMMQGAGGM